MKFFAALLVIAAVGMASAFPFPMDFSLNPDSPTSVFNAPNLVPNDFSLNPDSPSSVFASVSSDLEVFKLSFHLNEPLSLMLFYMAYSRASSNKCNVFQFHVLSQLSAQAPP